MFLRNLQPEWRRFTISIRQNHDLNKLDINNVFNMLKHNQDEVLEFREELKRKEKEIRLNHHMIREYLDANVVLMARLEKMDAYKVEHGEITEIPSTDTDAYDVTGDFGNHVFYATDNESVKWIKNGAKVGIYGFVAIKSAYYSKSRQSRENSRACHEKEHKKTSSMELAEYINTPGWNRPAFCNNGDDDDEDCTIAVTPDFSITDSLIMENEHLDTIPKTESDEFIKSSVENLVPIPSESENFSDIKSECDMPDCDDSQTTNFSSFPILSSTILPLVMMSQVMRRLFTK
nr:UBN2 domain-containing protein [Tanacetum cinerariifolium]